MSEEETKQEAADQFGNPGKINLGGEIRGHYSGCAAIQFENVGQMNTFFTEHPNMLVVDKLATADGVWVFYTRTMTKQDIDDLKAWSEANSDFMEKLRAKRQQEELDATEQERKAAAERERLIELGYKCERNHPKGPKLLASGTKKKGK